MTVFYSVIFIEYCPYISAIARLGNCIITYHRYPHYPTPVFSLAKYSLKISGGDAGNACVVRKAGCAIA
ncbi:hypothetical protein H6G35_31110 [Aulosira sp. FACHB-113]|uniref:hypothetical protein n=1 Tax=Tolypothrix tenuis TaxID=457083 RepID=UPI001685F06A|nr:hypothetical protein [Aulosira sp. FACHB-113]